MFSGNTVLKGFEERMTGDFFCVKWLRKLIGVWQYQISYLNTDQNSEHQKQTCGFCVITYGKRKNIGVRVKKW